MRACITIRWGFLAASLLIFCNAYTQDACPPNLGFEAGNFSGWECQAGIISASGVLVGMSGSAPVNRRHTIIKNKVPQDSDPYGSFPINCPNGSGYSIRLGNDETDAEADKVSYTFQVPATQNEYSFIFNYAIVFQNPQHQPAEQPRFTSKVYDVTGDEYISCGSFEFISSSGLPGFQLSPIGQNIYFKTWSQVTVKLQNVAGKTITIEFTVNDCSRGGHFGYAYLDVNENCTSPISGNVFCTGAASLTLIGPYGFRAYEWYNANFTSLLGTSNTLHLDPIPPVGTIYALVITPYEGIGCPDTLYTTIKFSSEEFKLVLKDTAFGCMGSYVDLTDPALRTGTSRGLKFSYYFDSATLEFLPVPSYVTYATTYYVKAVSNTGCSEIQPIAVEFKDMNIKINDPPITCYPNKVDITAPSITAGSDAGLIYSYWQDESATGSLTNPNQVDSPAVYFIKVKGPYCTKVTGVPVRITHPSQFKTNPLVECGRVDLTNYAATAGSEMLFTYTYWKDAAATIPLNEAASITQNGTYYIKATTPWGCEFVKPITATIKPLPMFTVTDPAPVTAPYTIDIRGSANLSSDYVITYWQDLLATKPLLSPNAITQSDTLYIKATDTATDCEYIQPVKATINIPYHPIIKHPNVFSPNGDGINDQFVISMLGNISISYYKVFDRYGNVVFETRSPFNYWKGDKKGKPMPAGTYYWMIEVLNNNNNELHKLNGYVVLLR